jgi:hypothetical protein
MYIFFNISLIVLVKIMYKIYCTYSIFQVGPPFLLVNCVLLQIINAIKNAVVDD